MTSDRYNRVAIEARLFNRLLESIAVHFWREYPLIGFEVDGEKVDRVRIRIAAKVDWSFRQRHRGSAGPGCHMQPSQLGQLLVVEIRLEKPSPNFGSEGRG